MPAAPVTVDLAVKPGGKLSATAGVDGDQVSISMTNQTTDKSFTKTLQMDNPDTSSAEWIAEAPSACQGSADGSCQTLPLADFGSVSFSGANATGNGHTGSAADWSATAMQLSLSASGALGGGQFGAGMGDGGGRGTASAGAVPSERSSSTGQQPARRADERRGDARVDGNPSTDSAAA